MGGGAGGVDASGVSCEGGAAPSGWQLLLSSVLPAPIIILTKEDAANCLLQAGACHRLIHEASEPAPPSSFFSAARHL